MINRHFPDFYHQISELSDNRTCPQYAINELIVSGLLIFLFKQGSRNQADNKAKNLDYQDNIMRFFKVRVADMDTVDRYLRFLPPQELEQVKYKMLQRLIRSKVFYKHRLLDQYYMLAIDGTGLQSYDYEPYAGYPHKTLKNGKKIWTT